MKKILFLMAMLICILPAYSSYYVTLSQNSITCEDGVGNTYQLKAYLHDGSNVSDVTESEDFTWATTDPSVATVDKGLVTIHADGTATISVSTDKYQLYDYGANGLDTCRVTSLPVGGTAVPMLREDLVWVSGPGAPLYCIKVKGDTVVNGTTYKKVYRFLQKNNYPTFLEDGQYLNGFIADSVRPVACMREDNGRVYRLRCPNPEETAMADERYDRIAPFFLYSIQRENGLTEYVQYDFNTPDVYKFVTGESFSEYADAMVEDTSMRVYAITDPDSFNPEYDRILVEVLGMLCGGLKGSDMLSPCLVAFTSFQTPLSVYYVRNNKGIVLIYNDRHVIDDDAYGNFVFAGDPYDFSGDGGFDIADVNTMINIMLNRQEDDPVKTADLTFDSAVDIEDLNLVINRLVSGVEPIKYSDIVP